MIFTAWRQTGTGPSCSYYAFPRIVPFFSRKIRFPPLSKLRLRRELITPLLWILLLLFAPAAIAQQVTMNAKDMPVSKVLKDIKRQTGMSLLLDEQLLKQTHPVSVHVTNMEVNAFLQLCLRDQPLTFEIIKHVIIIKAKGDTVTKAAASGDIRGQVTDASNVPLIGASVRISGTSRGASTDENGRFVLKGAGQDVILEISFLGYQPQTVHVSGNKGEEVQVGLAVSNNKLDETIVIGYGSTLQRYNTGSISKISSKDIEKQPVGNVLQALQGLVPGLNIVQNTSFSNGRFSIDIRGKKDLFSAGSPNNPLFIIDGVPIPTSNGDINNVGLNQNGFSGNNSGQNPLYSLNPADIESVEVLRDADATAIYGSRGANGVILINTKKGKAGRNALDVNIYTGITAKPKRTSMLNTQQYLQMRREAFTNSGETPDTYNAYDLLSWDTTRYTDWQRKLGASALMYDGELAYSGGNEYTSFRMSGGMHRENTPVPKGFPDNFRDQRISSQLSVNHRSKDNRFNLSVMVNYAATSSRVPGGSFYLFDLPPNAPALLDSSGKLNFKDWGYNMPFEVTNLFQSYKASTNNIVTNLSLSYIVASGLTLSVSGGYTNTAMKQFQGVPAAIQGPDPSANSGYAQFGTNNIVSWIAEPKATYVKQMGEGRLEAMVGATLTESITDGTNISGYGFLSDALLENVGSAGSLYTTSNYAQYRFQGYFGRINYQYKGKYIANISGRRDGSSRFKANDQMGNFGAVGVAWLFSEERFMKDHLSFLSFGKLRGSLGTTGSPAANDYRYLEGWRSQSSTYDGTPIISYTQPYNPGFKWQVNKKLEAAVELGFLKDRLSVSAAWYQERSDDQLVTAPVPGYLGLIAGGVVENIPAKVQNRGWEFTVNSTNIESKNFHWTTNFNISINRNKLLAFPNLSLSSYADSYVVGMPTTIQLVYHYQGVDPATGLYQFEDLHKDGIYDDRDKIPMDLTPAFQGGMLNTLTYKNWSLSFLLDYKKQKGPYSLTNGTPGTLRNQPVTVLARWQKEGDMTPVRKYMTSDGDDGYLYSASDANIVDASYLRLQNLSLSYNLPEKWMHSAKISTCRIYVQGQNLLVISPYKGRDPVSPELTGYDYPPLATFTAGIQLTL
ncbi:TonB-linked outer membrane protein, SusC/RagA family [Chitinophaga costaii]|uniref:TonB-linked outer membrane protein, SusC/RagA family n=1 Tax=Chitinophaga costaii TaxID=1335309 RepID=A0A1C4FLE2_9BACT|nr:SusC/RagA family TonB-linked outer membrane protein [Chitinophaga costaii]PUZ29989.1 SusC/RagA family TonB-linked outer membrane protein [Chitinophaga costaii]SCC56453.1 TonB-linked outer membrane protein, SusC/RagA family [Chitinophaga costaii]